MVETSRVAIILVVLLASTMILGCMEEEADNQTTSNNDNNDEGTDDQFILVPMEVDIVNIDYTWTEYPENPLAIPDLAVFCDAVNYGDSGTTNVYVIVNGTNSSCVMEQIVHLFKNQQISLKFYGKLEEEPVNISGDFKRDNLDFFKQPKVEEVDIEIVNLFHSYTGWSGGDNPELGTLINCRAINYGQPGFVTVVIDLAGDGFTKSVEQRIHLNWYEQLDLAFRADLPGEVVNLTASIKRPELG